MALKLLWKNPNTVATTIDIYRGDTAQVDLTTPLKTVDGTETSWIDTTALFGKTYYYVWAVNSDSDRVVSRPQKIEVSDRRGPGSNLLQFGDESYGFYGTVSAADFINSSVIYSALKVVSGIPSAIIYPTWYKYTRNGKVVFVPAASFGDTTWQNLYNAGLVYGTDDVGGGSPVGTVNQLVTFNLNGETFLVRLMKGMPDGLTWDGSTIDLNTLPAAQGVYSEFEDFIYPMVNIAPLRQRLVTVDYVNARNIIPTGRYSDRSGYGMWCQEALNTNTLVRASPGYDNANYSRENLQSLYARAKSVNSPWVPVVEYVGRVGETFTLPKTAK